MACTAFPMKAFAQLLLSVLACLGAWWLWGVRSQPWCNMDNLGTLGLPLVQWGSLALAVVLVTAALWLVIRVAKR